MAYRASDLLVKRKAGMELAGIVKNGMVVLENGAPPPEGTRVRVIVPDSAPSDQPVGQLLLEFAGLAQGLPEDMARNHDHYLYGLPKK